MHYRTSRQLVRAGADAPAQQLHTAAVPLALDETVELQPDADIVGRWRRRTNVWRRVTRPAT